MIFSASADLRFDPCRPDSHCSPLPLKVKAKGKWAHRNEKNFAAENEPARQSWRA